MMRSCSGRSVRIHATSVHFACIFFACAILLSAIARADWTPYDQLPGADRGASIAGSFNRSPSSTIRDVRWDIAKNQMWFRQTGPWSIVDLTTGAITPSIEGDDNAPAASRPRPSRKEPMAPSRGRQQPIAFSADKTMSAESRDGNLFLKCDNAAKRAVTTNGTSTLRYGTASWVYGEELDQTTGMWWSPTGEQLAFYHFDDAQVPLYTILSGLTRLRPEVETERYPKPGDPNPIVGLSVLDIKAFCADPDGDPSTHIRTIDVGPNEQYIYGVEYSATGDQLIFHRLNRRHDVLELCSADTKSGVVRVLVREEQPHWNHHMPEMDFLADGRRFIWSTERTGFKQYELRSLDSPKVIPLTSGEFPAGKIVEVNEEAGVLFYTAFPAQTQINPQLMSVHLDGTQQRRLTPDDLTYARFRISPDGQFFVASDETISRPPSAKLYGADGKVIAQLAEGASDIWSSRNIPMPELVKLKAADGVTNIYGTLHFPSTFDPKKSWPLIVDAYGGPYFANVFNRFSSPRADCELGFVILQIDNRGTPGRGKVFEDATYLKLGGPDLDDQAAAVRQITTRPGIDGSRVGITGMSYGGYMSAIALVRYPDVFKAAVARSGPMDWRQYDSIYTERFMRTPQENKAGYDDGSVLLHADKLAGKFMLIHGMQDDNVHPSNGWAIAQKLYDRDFSFDMLFFPKAGHGGFGQSEESALWSFFVRELKATPDGSSQIP